MSEQHEPPHWDAQPGEHAVTEPPEQDTLESVLEVVERETGKRKNKKYSTMSALSRIVVAMLVMVLAALVAGGFKTGHISLHDWPSSLWMFWMFALMGGSGVVAVSQSHKEAVRKLAEKFDDVRAVGPLAEALEFRDRDIRSIAETALRRLLPRLQASDASRLNTQQRACLNRALKRRNPDLVIAILKAYEQVRDEKALPFVERLAAEQNAIRNQRVQEAAQKCLPYLQQRAEQERNAQTLLRPASGFDTPPETLLRPAMGANPTDPMHLLRAYFPDGQLAPNTDSNLILTILNDLERSGDSRALPYVQQLAASEATSSDIRDAARRCAEALQTRPMSEVRFFPQASDTETPSVLRQGTP